MFLYDEIVLLRLRAFRNVDPRSTFIIVALLLWTIAVPAWWIQAGYESVAVTEKLGFLVEDRFLVGDPPCDPNVEGVGRHCFSDFQTPQKAISSEESWSYVNDFVIYPPPALVPFVVVDRISGVLNLDARNTMWLYLALSALALSVPAIFILFAKHVGQRLALGFLIGPVSLPALLVLDRGNNLAFSIPFLLLYGELARRKRYVGASLSLAVAVVIKPQFVLLYLLLLGLRQFRAIVVGALGTVSLLIAGFLVWPGRIDENIRGWVRNVASFPSIHAVSDEYPANLSAARATFQLSQITGVDFIYHRNFGLVVLLFAITTLLVRGQRMNFVSLFFAATVTSFLVPDLSFYYYLAIMLPPTAILLTSEEQLKHSHHWLSSQTVAVLAALTLVPLPIALGQSTQSISPHFSGLLCLIALLVILTIAWIPESKDPEDADSVLRIETI